MLAYNTKISLHSLAAGDVFRREFNELASGVQVQCIEPFRQCQQLTDACMSSGGPFC